MYRLLRGNSFFSYYMLICQSDEMEMLFFIEIDYSEKISKPPHPFMSNPTQFPPQSIYLAWVTMAIEGVHACVCESVTLVLIDRYAQRSFKTAFPLFCFDFGLALQTDCPPNYSIKIARSERTLSSPEKVTSATYRVAKANVPWC